MNKLALYTEEEKEDEIYLGEVPIGHPNEAEQKKLYVENIGENRVANVEVHVQGDGAQYVQLARDENGEPGVWADAGQSIFASEQVLGPGDKCSFWARADYRVDNVGHFDFDFQIGYKEIH